MNYLVKCDVEPGMIGMMIGDKVVAASDDCLLRDSDGFILGIHECVSDFDDEYDYAVVVSVKDGLNVISPDGRQAEIIEGWKAALCSCDSSRRVRDIYPFVDRS